MSLDSSIRKRRSIRKFTDEKVPEAVLLRAFEHAVLAPNSSNVQAWDFFWVQSENKKKALVEACLGQSAARTAAELVVAVADPRLWKRSYRPLNEWVASVKAPKLVQEYYSKLIPLTYRSGPLGLLGLLKSILYAGVGLFRPMTRRPATRRDLEEVVLKSSALACENFVLSIEDQGFSSCMMEGFDERRVLRLLGLSRGARVTMVIAVGRASERGTWGPQFRLPLGDVLHRV